VSQLKLFHCNTMHHAIQCKDCKGMTDLPVYVDGGLWMSYSDYTAFNKKKLFSVDQVTFGFCLPGLLLFSYFRLCTTSQKRTFRDCQSTVFAGSHGVRQAEKLDCLVSLPQRNRHSCNNLPEDCYCEYIK